MSRMYRIAAAVLFVTFVLTATSFAAAPKPKPHAVVGTLEKVEGQTIIVQTPNGAETVKLISGPGFTAAPKRFNRRTSRRTPASASRSATSTAMAKSRRRP